MINKSTIPKEYIQRINQALSFIDENLDTELTLETVSRVALYSPFHFHRIFKAITNETLNAYITRKRIEKMASILIRNKEVSITVLSLQYGFNSNSSFTRAFKKFYGISPTEFRKASPSRYSQIRKKDSKNGQEIFLIEEYICNIDNHLNWIKMNANIEVKELPQLELAFITHIGDFELHNTFDKLFKWAQTKGITNDPEFKMAMIYHDSFKVTDPGKVRMSACVVLKNPVKVDGEVGLTTIEKGKFIVARFEMGLPEFNQAWSSLFLWMNENGYKKAAQNPFEIYHNNPNEHPEKKYIVDLFIPVL